MHERERRLHTLIEPTVASLGFELVGVLCRGGRSRGLIRIYIDHDDGVTVDDCARVSHRVNGLLDVEDPIPGGIRPRGLVARSGSPAVRRGRLRPVCRHRRGK